jgi:hypothetical protein
MIELIASTIIASASTNDASEDINRFCAAVAGIPYASDNFNDEEWKRFKYCRDTLNQ